MAVPQPAASHPQEHPRPAESAPTAVPAAAPPIDQRFRNLQLILFTAGAILMPLGVIAILLGWYGVAHTKYQYDQLPYVVSGGLLGLAFVFLGGFLYFGAWLARIGTEQRESSQKLTEAVLQLVELTGRQQGIGPAPDAAADEARGELVLAGAGSTVHRRDCPLIAHREDLRPLGRDDNATLGTCRVCRPDFDRTV
jgi:hypothetical protein